MRLLSLVCVVLAFSLFHPERMAAQSDPSPAVREYLLAALDTIQSAVMSDEGLDWNALRDSALAMVTGARRVSDAYGAIEWALRRANKHSFLQARRPGAVHELLDGRIGYVHVPQRGGAALGLADSLHRAVSEMAGGGACGWIVDLRGNGGGNMWPMLAGVGPLLGDSLVGSFGADAGSDRWFYRNGVSGILTTDGVLDTITKVTVPPAALRSTSEPVAVLVDSQTASSGEAVAIAFLGRPNTRIFGTPTAGYATVNRGSRLPDGANMVLTTGYDVDRTGRLVGDRVVPDTVIPGLPAGWPFPTDRIGSAALQWLEHQTATRRTSSPCASPGGMTYDAPTLHHP